MSESDKLIKVPGTILWARYSFSPNRLKYCGPDANLDLFERAAKKINDKKIVEILSDFEAAFPYIQFIASENHIQDPFDWRVVEAYWLGNELLNQISLNKFYDDLRARFGKRIKSKTFNRIVLKIPAGAKPYHAFHVLEIFLQIGTLRKINLGPVLETINNCLISWGRVIGVDKNKLEVAYQPLLVNKKLFLAQRRLKRSNINLKTKPL